MIVHGYTRFGFIEATINGLRMTIPEDPTNEHRQMLAAWEEAGNTIPPYTSSTAPVPPLSRLTFWLAAAEIGVTKAGIRTHIDAMPEGVEKFQALAYLEEAQVYRRNDALLIQMAAAEGITEPELDALWAWAAQTYP
jgi:hypothetical protein